MELEYNGVRMELLALNRVSRVGVYTPDGADLLYVKWNISATCLYSPGPAYPVATAANALRTDTVEGLFRPEAERFQAVPSSRGFDGPIDEAQYTAFSQQSNIGFVRPVAPPPPPSLLRPEGYNAIMTDAELRSRLWTPRGTLKIWGYDSGGINPTDGSNSQRQIMWLYSPKPGLSTDVANGPKPIAVDVVEATGAGHTFAVHFQIETCTSPCPIGSDRVILSHRWEMEHDSDDDHYLTRVIKGEVVFNGEMLDTFLVTRPDTFRIQFAHPIPLGFRRGGPKLTQSSDGLTIRYILVDTDQSITFEPGDSGASQIEIVENLAYYTPDGVLKTLVQ